MLLVGALVLLIVVGQVRLFQGDSYKALYDGRWIASHGIPHTEAFSIAARRRWIDEEWLAELIFYETWRIGGYALVAIVAALSIAAAYMILGSDPTQSWHVRRLDGCPGSGGVACLLRVGICACP